MEYSQALKLISQHFLKGDAQQHSHCDITPSEATACMMLISFYVPPSDVKHEKLKNFEEIEFFSWYKSIKTVDKKDYLFAVGVFNEPEKFLS